MKVALFDDLSGGSYKTTKELVKYLEAHPDYEIEKSMYWDPAMTERTDISILEWAANNALQCSNWAWKGVKYDWSKKQLIVRPMDIEVYAGQYRGIHWDKLTDLVYTAKHIWGYMNRDIDFEKKFPNLKIHHIPLSVDMKEWTYKDRRAGKKIAVIGKMWSAKSPAMIFQFLDLLMNVSKDRTWEVHILGDWDKGTWYWMQTYRDNIIKALGLEKNVFLYDRVESVDEWLEDKNFLISFSKKDSFSLIIAEAMAKGIKAFPHNFWGAKDIYEKYVWSSIVELCYRILNEPYTSEEYRKFIDEKYSNRVIMAKWQEVLKKGGE